MIRRISALTLLTFREGIRERAIYGIGIAALFFSGISTLITSFFMRDLDKIAVDMNLASISFSSLLLIFFVSVTLMAKDIDRKTVYFILSKPFARWEYITGKLLGLTLLCTVAVLTLSIAGSAAIFYCKTIWPVHFKGFMWHSFFTAIYAHVLMLTLMNAIIVFYSTITTSSFLTLLFSVSTYITGQTIEEVYLYLQQQTQEIPLSSIVRGIIEAVHYLAPNLSVFDLKASAAHSIPVSFAYLFSISFYALVYVIILTGAASFIFEKKDFS